jgi:hypothetical protein
MGRPHRRGPPRRAPADRADPAGPLSAAGHRRGRLHPLRSRSSEPALPTRLRTLRTSLADRHQQQALRSLGRGVRRRRRRRRDDRPTGPPRRGHLSQGRQLPAQGPQPRPRPRGHQRRTMTDQGGQFSTSAEGQLQPPLTTSRSGVPSCVTGAGGGTSLSWSGHVGAAVIGGDGRAAGGLDHEAGAYREWNEGIRVF